MIALDFKLAKRSFFDRPAVIRAISKAERSVLSKFGAFVRRRAQSSLRPARRKTLGELTPREKQAFEQRLARWRRFGGPKPKLPRASAKPGQPPRLHVSPNPLKRLIFFSFDLMRRSVVVGPIRTRGGKAPERLEHGRDGWRRFPFMKPALEAEQDNLSALWRNSVKR